MDNSNEDKREVPFGQTETTTKTDPASTLVLTPSLKTSLKPQSKKQTHFSTVIDVVDSEHDSTDSLDESDSEETKGLLHRKQSKTGSVNSSSSSSHKPQTSPKVDSDIESASTDNEIDSEKKTAASSPVPLGASSSSKPLSHLSEGVRDLQAGALESIRLMTSKAAAAKASMKKTPRMVSVMVACASGPIMCVGVVDLILYIISLHFVYCVLKLYQIMFAALCLIVELSRLYDISRFKSIIHHWLPFMELNIGRGLLQILTAGLALSAKFHFFEIIPAAILMFCGVFTLAWGVKAALQLRALFKNLQETLSRDGSKDGTQNCNSGEMPSPLLMVEKKFAALNLNGDGKLTKEELELGCQAFNIELKEGDVDLIFALLDTKNKGYIGIDDFEVWWHGNRSNALTYLMV